MSVLFVQPLFPVGGNLALSALVAALPLALLFVMLGVFKLAAWKAALGAVTLAVILSVAVWGMPLATAASTTAQGIFFGMFQIMWILVSAIFLYNLSVKMGWDKVLGDLIHSISSDMRILAILIAFTLGALLEALAGFGAPVAITAAMLVAAGMKPLKAAIVCLVANTAPVAFGAMGAPITALGNSAFPQMIPGHFANATQASVVFGQMAGRQTPIMALFIPLLLVWLVDGKRGIKETWGVALTAGAVFATAQFVSANFIAYEVTDVIASVVTLLVLVPLLRFRKPSAAAAEHAADKIVLDPALPASHATGGARVWGAIAPYAIVVGVFSLSQIPAIKTWLATTLAFVFNWPGLQAANFAKDAAGKVVAQPIDFCGIVTASQAKAGTLTSCTLGQVNLYAVLATGTLLFLSALITAAVYKMGPATRGRGLRQDGQDARLHDHHGRFGSWHCVHHEWLGNDHFPRVGTCLGRCSLRPDVAGPGLAGRCHHRFRHVLQRPVRRHAGRGVQGCVGGLDPAPDPDGDVQLDRRRPGQDDLAANTLGRGGCSRNAEPGGRHFP